MFDSTWLSHVVQMDRKLEYKIKHRTVRLSSLVSVGNNLTFILLKDPLSRLERGSFLTFHGKEIIFV